MGDHGLWLSGGVGFENANGNGVVDDAEYVALSTAMRSLLPFKTLMMEISGCMGMNHEDLVKIKTKVWEHNSRSSHFGELGTWKNYITF